MLGFLPLIENLNNMDELNVAVQFQEQSSRENIKRITFQTDESWKVQSADLIADGEINNSTYLSHLFEV